MITEPELFAAVETAFGITGRGHAPWPDPHPDRSPLDEITGASWFGSG